MATMMSSKAKSGVRSASVRASRASVVVRAARELWYPGASAPKHLNGTLPGDRGFDPLRLGTDPERLKWFAAAEVYNGQIAMVAAAGIMFTELVGLPKWWLAGAEPYPIDVKTQLLVGVPIFALLEGKRYEGWKKTGGSGVLSSFPFDPMGMSSPERLEKEIKNGRLAMLACVGFASTAAVNGKGPIESLLYHIADPFHNNIYTTSVGKEFLVTVAVLSMLPMIIEATKTAGKEAQAEPLFPWNSDAWSK